MRGPAAIALLLAACDPGGLQAEQRAIVGGQSTDNYPQVVEILLPGEGGLTGTLIGDRTVLTSAHELVDAVEDGMVDKIRVYVGTDSMGGDPVEGELFEVVDAIVHPYYAVDTTVYYDVGMVRLASSTGISPLAFNQRPVEELLSAGDEVIAVGFGQQGRDDTSHRKHEVALPVVAITPRYIAYRSADKSTCFGDSGGPHLVDVAGTAMVVATTSIGGCDGFGIETRVDRYLDFIFPVLDAWEGPCKQDGVCVTEGCRTADPDCDPCGLNDRCADDCPVMDLDCPLRTRFGERCESDAECASGLCTAEPSTTDRYCTVACFSETEAAVMCQALMECRSLPAHEEPVCVFSTEPTPKLLGESCDSNADCRSEVCSSEIGACVMPCSERATCPDDFECTRISTGTLRVCAPAASRCGCNAGAASRAHHWEVWAVAVLLFGLALRRRRVPGLNDADVPHAGNLVLVAGGGVLSVSESVAEPYNGDTEWRIWIWLDERARIGSGAQPSRP